MVLANSMSARIADQRAERAELAEMELVAGEIDEDALCTTLVRQIDAARRYGDYATEGEAIEQLRCRARRGGRMQWLAAAAEARAARALREADHSGALAGALEARDIYGALGDDAAQARAGALAARVSCTIRDGAKTARRLADDALRLARRAGDAGTMLRVLASAGFVAQQRQDYPTMAELSREALALCLEVGSRPDEIRRRTSLGIALWRMWHIEEALETLKEALRISESVGIVNVLRPSWATSVAPWRTLGIALLSTGWNVRPTGPWRWDRSLVCT